MSSERKSFEHDPYFEQTHKLLSDLRTVITNNFAQEDAQKIEEGIQFCIELHVDQEREDGPYVDHLLRVALRLVKEFEVRDRDSVIAALLHDSVEDQPAKLAKGIEAGDATIRTLALEELGKRFSERVSYLVQCLTNSDHIDYFERIEGAIEDADVALIKLCDFFDNSRVDSSTPPLPEKLLHKYIRAADIYYSRFSKEDVQTLSKYKILEKITDARSKMNTLLVS